jgi:putative addiction module component (TIGR02574 family)
MMTEAAEQLLEQVMRLEPADRVELVDRVVEAVELSEEPEYLAEWEAEIRERIGEIERGEVKMVPSEEVLDKLGQDN